MKRTKMDARYAVLLLLNIICRVIGRARLVEPPMRSSIWRHDFQAPVNYMDELLNCGGFQVRMEWLSAKTPGSGTYGSSKVERSLMVRWVVGSILHGVDPLSYFSFQGVRCSSVVRAFAHGAMGRRIDPSWDGLIELFLVPASVPRLV